MLRLRPCLPPIKKLTSQTAARMTAMMNSQCAVKATPKTMSASTARTRRRITTTSWINDRELRTKNAVQLATGGSSEEQEL
jgi:hypothetical protein